MPYSGGTFSLYATGNPVVTGTTISSSWANNTLTDIASGLSSCVLKDGTQTITANIPMSSFKLTGLAAGTTAGDSLRYEQAVGVFLPLAGGTMTGNLLFTDATYDIGATGATRPRDIFLSRNAVIGGTTSFGGNIVSNILFTDATYDIGASGATRPRDLFLSRNAVIGGDTTITGAVSAATAAGAVVATQANMETGTATNVLVSPGRQALHLGHPKAVIICTDLGSSPFTATVLWTSIGSMTPTTNGTGDFTLAWSTNLTNPAPFYSVEPESTVANRRLVQTRFGGNAAASLRFTCYDESGTAATPAAIYVVIMGNAA